MNTRSAELTPPDGLRELLYDPAALARRQAQTDRVLIADGAGHLVHDLPMRVDGRTASLESRPWRLDPIPVVLDAATFGWLRRAVAERMDALEAVISDLYGERRLIREGVVPAETLAATASYQANAVGRQPRRWLSVYATDVVLDTNGVWSIVQDLTDTPAGIGYALLNRSVIARVMPDIIRRGEIASLGRFGGALRSAIAAVSTVESPRTALFSGGLDHPSFVDHSYLAVELGINLVEGADLVVRQRRVWLRTLDGLEPVDVLYRRIADRGIDPLEIGAVGGAGVPGLMQAVRNGGVALANAHGTGVVESAALAPYIDEAIAALAPTRQRIGRYGDTSSPPGTALAMVPVAPDSVASDIERAPVVLRLYAVSDGDRVTVLPGASGRVLRPGDDPRSPTAATSKDVWVVGSELPPVVGARLPQVDFGRSVPTRAADALYWTNRYAERAELLARVQRSISARVDQDPTLPAADGGRWARDMCRLAAAVRRDQAGVAAAANATADDVQTELHRLDNEVGAAVGSLLTETITVREFLSVTTGRVLSRLAELRAGVQHRATDVDDLDEILLSLSAFAGLWRESIVRGPAWRIGDTGRRLERCLVTLDVLDATVGAEAAPSSATIEVMLSACESLVAYRRRHRSDVEVAAALNLIVSDETNPRSLAAAIADLDRHGRDGEVTIDDEFVRVARGALSLPVNEMIPIVRDAVQSLSRRIVSQWFSTPVDPQTLRVQARRRAEQSDG